MIVAWELTLSSSPSCSAVTVSSSIDASPAGSVLAGMRTLRPPPGSATGAPPPGRASDHEKVRRSRARAHEAATAAARAVSGFDAIGFEGSSIATDGTGRAERSTVSEATGPV